MKLRDCMVLAVLGVLVAASRADAVCNATKLCEPGDDPCIVSAACTVPAGATFDVRPRALVVKKPLTIGTGIAPTRIIAGSILIEPEGDVVAAGSGGGSMSTGGWIKLEATTTIETRSQGNTRSKLRADAALSGGTIQLTAGGDVVVSSSVNVAASGTYGIGGSIEIVSGGSIQIVDNGGGTVLKTTGGNSEDGSGGFVSLFADQSVLIDGEIDASNGSSFAEVVVEAANGSITTTSRGRIEVNASVLGDGGSADLAAAGPVSIAGIIEAKGAGSGSGENAEGGYGGIVTITGADVALTAASVDLRGAGPDGDGGELDVEATRSLVLDAPVSVEVGGFGFGGEVSLFAEGDVDVKKKVDADGGDTGGVISIVAVGNLTVRSQLSATGDRGGGAIELQGCGLDVLAGASVSTAASPQPFAQQGRNTLTASGQMTVGGTLTAAGSNVLQYRSLQPFVTGTVVPAPVRTKLAQLPCCIACDEPTTTTTSSVTTSSVSTTVSTTVTTSSVSTTVSTTVTTSTVSTTVTTVTTSSVSVTSSSVSSTSSTASSTSTSTSTSSTSTTTSTSTTSSTANPTTSTSVTTSTSTTSSTVPADECAEPGPTAAGARCRIDVITREIALRSDDEIGGKKQRRRLLAPVTAAKRQVEKALSLLDRGKPAPKVAARLRRATNALVAFDRRVQMALERGTVAESDGEHWLALSREARSDAQTASAP